MKINQRLILGFFGNSLLLGLVGYVSIITNSESKYSALIASQGIKQKVQGATDKPLTSQETQIAIYELIETRELASLAQSQIERSKIVAQKIEAIKQYITNIFTLITAVLAGSLIFRSILKPLSKLKEKAEQIEEAEKINTLLPTPANYAADAIEITDAEARYKYVHPAGEKIIDYQNSEVLGKTPRSLLQYGKYDYKKIMDTLASGQVWSSNCIGERQDRTYHQEVTISPETNTAGAIAPHVAVKRDINQRQQAEERLKKINECFLSFGINPTENINRLTALFGELLGATCTLYNRLEGEMLYSVGQWQTPTGYNSVDTDGHICYEVIQQGSDEIFVMHDLLTTTYAQTDPNIMADQLNTCVGKAIKCRQTVIGSLCALYQTNYIPNEADREIVGIIAAAIGVEEERRAMQESLRESEERYALATRAANDGLWDWNLKTNKVYFSPRSKAILGYGEEEIGNGWEEFFRRVHPQDIEPLKAAIASHLEGLTPHFESEYRVLHPDRQYRWILCRGLAVRDAEGKPDRFAGSQTDITQRKQTESQLLHQAFHDALTGLPNRLLFMERLEYVLKRAKWSPDYAFAVLFLDLDRFKVVNDSLGHALGDQLLVALAHRLEACVRHRDTVARLGGDEFSILLEDIKDLSEAKHVAERIQKQLSLPFHIGGHEVFTTASIGIAISHDGYEQPEDLLRDADTTMYRAKALGKARYEVFDQTMHNQAMARLQLETELRRALERQELQVYYQPIVSLKQGRMAGFEALVRWQHPQRGFVSPAEFIPLAEETGLIIPLGWCVLQKACQQMHSWLEQFPLQQSLTVSVNISSKQFAQPNLCQKIEQILQEIGLPADHLRLELTESVLVDNAEAAVVTLKQLKALGIGLSIDDFGTGYSSLSYLHQMPIDTLKIDRSFVNNVEFDPEKIEIIRTIIALAWNLGMNVVAEGVETKKQMYQLQALKCEFGQGYFFSKPVDSQMAEALLSSEPSWDRDVKLAAR